MDQKANSIADMAAVLQRQTEVARTHQQQAEQERENIRKATEKANLRYEEIKSLLRQLRPTALNGDEEALKQYKVLKNEKIHIRKSLEKPMPHRALKRRYHPLNDAHPVAKQRWNKTQRRLILPRMSTQGLRIKWANILDAEFAQTWPSSVIHEALERATPQTRHTHPPATPPQLAPTQAEEVAVENNQAEIAVQTPPSAAAESPVPEALKEPSRLERLVSRLRDGRN